MQDTPGRIPLARRWRPLQFSLRTLLVLVMISSLAGAWVHRARRQREAVAALRASNPSVETFYGDQLDAAGGAWLRTRLGVDYVANVDTVELFYATDADLECVAHLANLRRLNLVRSIDVTDRGLEHLVKLPRLKSIAMLDADSITDAGLRLFENMPWLEELKLELRRDRVSSEAVERLQRALPKCRVDVLDSASGQGDMARARRDGATNARRLPLQAELLAG